jgi:hypothetical protein
MHFGIAICLPVRRYGVLALNIEVEQCSLCIGVALWGEVAGKHMRAWCKFDRHLPF